MESLRPLRGIVVIVLLLFLTIQTRAQDPVCNIDITQTVTLLVRAQVNSASDRSIALQALQEAENELRLLIESCAGRATQGVAEPTQSAAELLIGRWEETGTGRGYTFYEDGTGIMSVGILGDSEITYTVNGDQLIIRQVLAPSIALQAEIVEITETTLRLGLPTGVLIYHRR